MSIYFVDPFFPSLEKINDVDQNCQNRIGHFVRKMMVNPIILPNIDRSGEVNNKKFYEVQDALGKKSLPGRNNHYRHKTTDMPRVLMKDQSGTSLISLQPSSFRGLPNE